MRVTHRAAGLVDAQEGDVCVLFQRVMVLGLADEQEDMALSSRSAQAVLKVAADKGRSGVALDLRWHCRAAVHTARLEQLLQCISGSMNSQAVAKLYQFAC